MTVGGRGFEVIRGNPGEMTTGGGWDPLKGLVNDVLVGFCRRGNKVDVTVQLRELWCAEEAVEQGA